MYMFVAMFDFVCEGFSGISVSLVFFCDQFFVARASKANSTLSGSEITSAVWIKKASRVAFFLGTVRVDGSCWNRKYQKKTFKLTRWDCAPHFGAKKQYET